MKKNFALLSLCAAAGALAQVPVPGPAPQGTPPSVTVPPPTVAPSKPVEPRRANPLSGSFSNLTRFDVDFPGGKPDDLVEALNRAIGKPGAVNVVIHQTAANVLLPAVRVRNASVADVFAAIQTASRRDVAVPTSVQTGMGGKTIQNYSYRSVQHQFVPAGNEITDDTVWSFVSNEPETVEANNRASQPAREIRYFTLRDYLSDSLTVEDITTAIRIGWEMLRVEQIPDLKFHKETGILITAGDPNLLEQIPAVLQQLPGGDADNWKRSKSGRQTKEAPVPANPAAPAAPAAPAKPAAPSPEIPKPAEKP